MAELPLEANRQCTDDEIVLLRTFPAEIWSMIFLECNSESLLALRDTSFCFQNFLLPRRTVYLFPQVWSVVKDTYLKIVTLESQQKQSRNTRHPILSRVSLAFLRSLTLMLRLVCKDWRDGVDSVNLKELHAIKTNPRKFLRDPFVQDFIAQMEANLNSHFNYRKFQEVMLKESSEKDSKLIKTITIQDWSPEVFSLLKRIGCNVLYCTIRLAVLSSSNKETYMNIRDCLKLLPNLKTLDVLGICFEHKRNADDQLLKTVGNNPINTLKRLEVLGTKFLSYPIFNEIVRSNSQIKTLYVDGNSCCGPYAISAKPMSNLEDLSFQIFTNADIEELCKACLSWKRVKLYLFIENHIAIDWDKLIEFCREKLKYNFVKIITGGEKLKGLGAEVAAKLEQHLRLQRQFGTMYSSRMMYKIIKEHRKGSLLKKQGENN